MVETTEQYRARINQLKTSIENEPYIQKMRENIAEGISKTGNRQADIEDQFQEVIDNTTGKDVIAAPELIAARNGEANLKARLDKEQQEVATQLAQKASINYVDAILMDIAKGGPNSGPQGPFMSIAALKAYDFPEGKEGTWLVFDISFTDGAHSFMWDSTNSLWKDLGVYQAMGISDNSLPLDKIEGAESNLFIASTAKDGYVVTTLTGEESPNTLWVVSDFIKVIPNTVYEMEKVISIPYVAFDKNKNPVWVHGSIGERERYRFTTRNDTHYIKINIKKSLKPDWENFELFEITDDGFPKYRIKGLTNPIKSSDLSESLLSMINNPTTGSRKKYESSANNTLLEISTSETSIDKADFVGANNPLFTSESGLYMVGKQFNRLRDSTFKYFKGLAGLRVGDTVGTHSTLTASELLFLNNKIGFLSEVRAEYITISNSQFNQNEIGAQIRGGNVQITNSMICNNVNGIEILAGSNDSHGIISNCQINHNTGIALLIDGISVGETISSCHFYDATIHIKNVINKPVRFDNCVIAGDLILENNVKVIFNNCFFPAGYGLIDSVITNTPIEGHGNEIEETQMESVFNTY